MGMQSIAVDTAIMKDKELQHRPLPRFKFSVT